MAYRFSRAADARTKNSLLTPCSSSSLRSDVEAVLATKPDVGAMFPNNSANMYNYEPQYSEGPAHEVAPFPRVMSPNAALRNTAGGTTAAEPGELGVGSTTVDGA